MHTNSCLHTHHLYEACIVMPNKRCYMHMHAYEHLPSYPTRYEAASLWRCCTGTVATIGSRHNSKCHAMQCDAMPQYKCHLQNPNTTYSIMTREQAMIIYTERCIKSLFNINSINHDWIIESHVCQVSTKSFSISCYLWVTFVLTGIG